MSEIGTRTGGEWVVAALEAEGVRHVFGIPGVHNLGITHGRTGEPALAGPDVLALARAFGVETYHAPDPGTFRSALDKALSQAGPVLVEVPLAIAPPWDL